MSHHLSRHRGIVKQAAALGARDIQIGWGSKYPFVTGRTADGRKFKMTFAGSPSCYRAEDNARARLKRLLQCSGQPPRENLH